MQPEDTMEMENVPQIEKLSLHVDDLAELLLQCPPNEHGMVLESTCGFLAAMSYLSSLDLGLIAPDNILTETLVALHNKQTAVADLIHQTAHSGGEESEDATEKLSSDDSVIDVSKEHVLISAHNYMGECKWYEPCTGAVFQVDPVSLQASPLEDEEPITDLVPSDVMSAVQAYVLRTLDPKSASWGAYRKINDNSGDSFLHLTLVGARMEKRNMWSGRWQSEWALDGAYNSLTGTITAFVHYFEEGNIQLRASKTIENIQVEQTGSDSDIYAVLAFIEAEENAFQLALNEAYAGLQQSAFKRLRRQLPVTRTKMDWTKIGAMGLGSELSSRCK